MNSFNFKYITDLIFELEEKYDLLKWKIEGVFVWQTARARIYRELNNAINNKKYNSYTVKKYSILPKLKRFPMTSTVLNPYLDFKKTESLIFESERKEVVDDETIDIHTEYLCNYFDDTNKSYTLYSVGLPTRKNKTSVSNNKSLDFVSLISKLSLIFLRIKINTKEKSKICDLEHKINNKLNINFDLYSILSDEIKRYKSQYISFNLLFKLKKPKNIFIIGSSYKAPLIRAAKDLKVVVNEMQHGLLIKESVIANFPFSKEDEVEYFPNRFYIWDGLDMCNVSLPLSKGNIFYFPNIHLEKMINKYDKKIRNQNLITIVSQPSIGYQIFDYIIESSNKMQDWKFIFKFHPLENLSDYNITNFENMKYDNIKFVFNETSIYKLLSESSIVIGVFSTALFEALYFGCKIILLDIPGVELAKQLENKKNVIKIKLTDDLQDKVKSLLL